MSPDILHTCLSAVPFASFTLGLSDHNEVHVENAFEAQVSQDGKTLLIERGGARVIVAMRHIVSITFDKPGGRTFGFGS